MLRRILIYQRFPMSHPLFDLSGKTPLPVN